MGRATAGSSQLSYKQFKSKVRLLDALLSFFYFGGYYVIELFIMMYVWALVFGGKE